MEVIDISSWQGAVDFTKVKAAGIGAVILRCGFTGYRTSLPTTADNLFEKNYAAAAASGLKIGVYYYSCATDEKKALEEARFTLNALRGKKIDFPVYFDTEDNHNTSESGVNPKNQITIGADKLTAIADVFCSAIVQAGYTAGIYSYLHWLNSYIHMERLTAYETWVAQYYKECQYEGPFQMWQYTNTGLVPGISGNVDRNQCYQDYSADVPEVAGLVQYPMQRNAIVAGFDWAVQGGKKSFQYGIAISNTQPAGYDVYAAHTGSVVAAGFDEQDGNCAVVRGGYSARADILTRYANLASFSVAAGDGVARGQRIGVQGDTGAAPYRRLLFETWLVPKNYTYNLADRPQYAVDPVSLCHLLPGQSFPFVDAQSHGYAAIPYPDPAPQSPVALRNTAAELIGAGPAFYVAPDSATSPIVAGEDRTRALLSQFCGEPRVPALQKGTVAGKAWVQIESCLGLFWIPLTDGLVRLVDTTPPDESCEEKLRRYEETFLKLQAILCSPP